MLSFKPVIHVNFHDAPNKAIICLNSDEDMTIVEFMGPALRYWIDNYGTEDLPIEPGGPGLWYIEGDIRSYKSWTDCGYEYDEEWVTSVCRRLTPEELETYQTHGRTPFQEEAEAEGLMLYVEQLCGDFEVTADNDTFHVVLWQDGYKPQNWKDFDRFSFTIQEYLTNRKHVERLAGKLVESLSKWNTMKHDAWCSQEMMSEEPGDSDY